LLLSAATALAPAGLKAANLYWDTDPAVAGTGGTGAWSDDAATNWSSVATGDTAAGAGAFTSADIAYFTGDAGVVTLASSITVGGLNFGTTGYQLTGSTLTLSGASEISVSYGDVATISSVLAGSSGLLKSGGGILRLTNSGNTFDGITITNGTLHVSSAGALGTGDGVISITERNQTPNNGSTLGFGGGALLLDGSAGSLTVSRDISAQGYGPIGGRSGAIFSVGDVTLSGDVVMVAGALTPNTYRNTRFISSNGKLSFTGSLTVNGTAGTHFGNLGGSNSGVVPGMFSITGSLIGTGTLQKSGAGVLFLSPSDATGFSGRIRISSSAATGQSSVRVTDPAAFGTANSTGTSATIDIDAGMLEVFSDAGVAFGKHVYGRNSSNFIVGRALGSAAVNGLTSFGAFTIQENTTQNFYTRDGYAISFGGSASINGSTNSFTLNNAASGGVRIVGDLWGTTKTSQLQLTMSGNGDTTVTGGIMASGISTHYLTKNGNGVMTIEGVTSTLPGTVQVLNGELRITDFRSLTNNTSRIDIGSTSTAGVLIIGTSVAATSAGLSTMKVINLNGTTGAVTIYANQASSSPVIFGANFTATGAGSKTLYLGGSNTAENRIDGAIVDNSASNKTSVTKVGPGTWALGGVNTYTGTTSITNGTLKILANAATSTVLNSTSAVKFTKNADYSGGALELVGLAGTATTQALGALSYDNGSATIRLSPGLGGTASLSFTNVSTTGGATINFVGGDFANNTFTLTQVNAAAGTDGIITRSLYWNGADYAYRQSGVLRAPVYGVDTGTASVSSAFVASSNNLVTADFATNSVSVSTIKLDGSRTVTINSGQTLTLSGGGLLVSGGDGVVTGGTLALGSGALVARTDLLADTLTINSVITGSGGLTKSGLGTLILAGVNTRTGELRVDEGTLRLDGSGVLGGANVTTFVRQGATLDLNGHDTGTAIGAIYHNGVITNSSSTAATLVMGNNNQAGTLFGLLRDGTGLLNVTKVGTNNITQIADNTYTGVTTIGSTGLLIVPKLADGGQPSPIGASSSAAANLVFNGSTGGIRFDGNVYDYNTTLGYRSSSTDRLFTLAGTGATISSNANNYNSVSWTNTGDIAFGASSSQLLTFDGTSQGQNTFVPRLTDPAGFVLSVTKNGTGVWGLKGGLTGNTYSGPTLIKQGVLMAEDGAGLSSASNLVFAGGTLYASGSFTRDIGTGAGQMQFEAPPANTAQYSGGFQGGDTKLTVLWSGAPVWGSTTGFLASRDGFILNSSQARSQGTTGSVAMSEVDIAGDFSLGSASVPGGSVVVTTTSSSTKITVTTGDTSGLVVGQTISGSNIPGGSVVTSIESATVFYISNNASAAGTGITATANASPFRVIRVEDNGWTGADFATISGDISGTAGTGIRKTGGGVLRLSGANTYAGVTDVNGGSLAVYSLGSSLTPGVATSVGLSTDANLASRAVMLGNGSTGSATLQYLGAGEVSDRMIRLNTTTGSPQIHADGTGALVLTNVVNDLAAGAKRLYLRGSSTAANTISGVLANNDSTNLLSLTVDGSGFWVLSGANTYSGNTTVSAGAAGVGNDLAFGTSSLTLSGGTLLAYGADRTLANAATLGNNVTQAFQGDHSLTFSSAFILGAAANNMTLNNGMMPGAQLVFAGGLTANSLTANRTWSIDGPGETVLQGVFSSSTTFGVSIWKSGSGTLDLGLDAASNFNQGGANIDLDRGVLRMSASGAIPSGSGKGGLVISPDLADSDTATFDLNGTNQTINALTATTNGVVVIDNTSSQAASLTFGAADAAVSFGAGVGTYTITDSGAGPLSIAKTGAATVLIPAGVTLSYQGSTTVSGGSLTIASPLAGTSGLSAAAGTTLALTGGITTPSAVTSVSVGAGATLSLLDGAGSDFSSLQYLGLGTAGGGAVTLKVNVGDTSAAGDGLGTDRFSLLTGGSLSLPSGTTVTFNLTDAGLNGNTSYTLVSSADGGLTTGAITAADWILGTAPGGFTSVSFSATDTAITFTTGSLITGPAYWSAASGLAWNAAAANWTTDKAGSTAAASIPGAGTDVIFGGDLSAGGTFTTTLEQNFRVNSLKFESSATTPTSVTIAPGVDTASRLEISPQSSTDGITLVTGGPATVTISSSVKVGADQTWSVASGMTLSVGTLFGNGDVDFTGLGTVILTAAADPTFNATDLASFSTGSGTLELQNAGALGTAASSNLANLLVGGIFYYNNGTSGTVANPVSLNGGTIAAGGNNQTYSGAVSVATNSTISLKDKGTSAATARTVTLSGVVAGTGSLTVNSIATLSSGNPLTGTLVMTGVNSDWSGGIVLQQGTVDLRNAAAAGTGALSATGGRIYFKGTGGSTWSMFGAGLTLDGSGAAPLELQPDYQSGTGSFTLNVSGPVTLGGTTGAAPSIRVYQADALSTTLISGPVSLLADSILHASGAGTTNYLPVEVSGAISGAFKLSLNADTTWGSSNYQVIRLTGANTFSGDFVLKAGTVEFDTVSNAGGSASSLGTGTAITVGGTMRFIGSTSQSTNRPMTSTANVTLAAAGSGSATITFSGGLTQSSNQALTLLGPGAGVFSGALTQAGTAADINVNSGAWTLSGNLTIADDILVTGTTLGSADLTLSGSVAFNSSTGNGFFARDGGRITIAAADITGVGNSGGLEYILIGDTAAAAAGNFVVQAGASVTTPRLDLGGIQTGREGNMTGDGTIVITGTATDYSTGVRLYRGTVALGLSGGATVLKQGLGNVTLSGDNSGLTITATATRLDSGTLTLDYTTSNATKLPVGAQMDARGLDIRLIGAAAGTVQTVASTNLGNTSGMTRITLEPALNASLEFNIGAISRSAGAGTLRLVNLPNGTSTGILTTSTAAGAQGLLGTGAWATVTDATGTWFATKDASLGVVAAVSTALNDVTAWTASANVVDTGSGYTGVTERALVNSLIFAEAAGSTVTLTKGGLLSVASGGIMVTDSVVAGIPSVTTGYLTSGTGEVIVFQDSARTFVLGADLGAGQILTKSGAGTVRLTGTSAAASSNYVRIQEGVIEVRGGSAVGDRAVVELGDDRDAVLRLLDDETIGNLTGGNNADGMRDQALVAIGDHVLTIDTTGGSGKAYAGKVSGSGTLIKTGLNVNLQFTNESTAFGGSLIVNGGLFYLSVIGRIDASEITVNNGGNFLIDNNGSTRRGDRILDTTPIYLNSASGAFSGSTILKGLAIRTDQNATTTEVIGDLVFSSGASYLTVDGNVSSGTAISVLAADDFIRAERATFSARGRALGASTGHRGVFKIGTAANETAFISSLVGGAGAAATKTISIIPWAIGALSTGGSGAVVEADTGNTFLTYVASGTNTYGLRPLVLATEFGTLADAGNTNNTRESLTASLTGVAGRTVNSFIFDHNGGATLSLSLSGSGAGQALTVTSGAMLFTSTGGTGTNAYTSLLSGFDGGILAGGTEYVLTVQNPSSAASTPSLTAEIASPLLTAADITKSGRGTLVLSGANTAGGGARRTTINEGVLEVADLDNIGGGLGELVFAGGTLRLGAGFADDISTRTIRLLQGGGTIDTNGADLTLAGSAGSGLGALTKAGLGTLTLGAASTYSGGTVVTGGTLALGTNNATGTLGDLSVVGATYALGSFTATHRLVSTSGAAAAITGAGTISASSGFFFNHTGNTTLSAVLAGEGGLSKAQSGTLTLDGASTYRGITEVQNGTLVISSVSSVGGGASSIGSPQNAFNGVIRLGYGTTAATLSYQGSGHASDRDIGLTGTTGLVTLDSSGTGAVSYGSVTGYTAGARTLKLIGTLGASFANTLTSVTNGAAALTLTKDGPSRWNILGATALTGNIHLNDGAMRFGGDVTTAGNLVYATANTLTTVASAEFAGDASFASMTVQMNSTGRAGLDIAAGKTVTVGGNVLIGSGAGVLTSTILDFTGAGTFAAASSSATAQFRIGGSNGAGNYTEVDMSGLGALTVNYTDAASIFRVGSTSGTNISGAYSVFLTPPAVTITAGKVVVGDGGQLNGSVGQINLMTLGSGAAVFNVDSFNVGIGARDLGKVSFAGSSGTFLLRARDGAGRAALNIGTGSANTGVPTSGDNELLLAGHSADLLVGTLTIGGQNRNANRLDRMTFDTGVLDVTTAVVGDNGGSASGTAVSSTWESRLEIGGGTVTIGSGGLEIGRGDTSISGSDILKGIVVISGGAVTIANNAGFGGAVRLGYNSVSTLQTRGELNLLGGTVTLGGAIVKGGSTGTGTGTVLLDGATLEMGGNSIGSASATITFNALAGTLRDVGTLNGTGGLTKTGAGLLTIEGASAFTGATTVSEGTLQIAAESGLGPVPGAATAGHLTLGGASTQGVLKTTATTSLSANRGVTLAAGGGAFDVAASTTLTIGSVVTGTGALTKSGAGLLDLLMGTPQYSGTTTVNGGTLRFTNVADLAAVNTTAFNINNGATLEFQSSVGGSNRTVLNNKTFTFGGTGGGTINFNNGNHLMQTGVHTFVTTGGSKNTISQTNDGFINNQGSGNTVFDVADGTDGVDLELSVRWSNGTLSKQGLGTMAITGVHGGNYALDIVAGVLEVGGASSLNGGTFTAAITNEGTFRYVSSAAQTISGVISGGGAVTQGGSGTLELSGANTFTGATLVSAGTLTAGAGALAGTSGITVNGAILAATDYNLAATLTLDAAATASISAADLTITGAISNAGTTADALNFTAATGKITLTSLAGAGKTRFGADAEITGGISAGTVTVVGAATVTTLSGGTLNLNGATASIGTLTAGTVNLSAATSLTVDGGTFAGSLLGSGTLVKATAGILTLAGANGSFSGATIINGGQLVIQDAGALGSGAVSVGAGATLNLNSLGISNAIAVATGGTIVGGIDVATVATTGTSTVSTVLTGADGLGKADAGELVLATPHFFTGAVTATNAGAVISAAYLADDSSSLGASALTDPTKLVLGNGATLNFTGTTATTTSRSFTINGSAVLAASGSASSLTFGSAAIVALDPAFATPALKLVANNAAVNRFEAVLSQDDLNASRGISVLEVDGAGTWVIAGSSVRFKSGLETTVTGGTLAFTAGALGGSGYTGAVTVADGARLRWESGNTDDISARLTVPALAAAVLDVGSNTVSFAATPSVGTDGSLVKQGSGVLVIGAASTGSYDVTLSSGRLVVNGSVGDVAIASGATLGGGGSVGNVTVGSGGVVAPGNSPDTLYGIGMTLVGGSVLDWEVFNPLLAAGVGYDSIELTGNMDLSGASSSNRVILRIVSLNALNVRGAAPLNFNSDAPRSFEFAYVGGVVLPGGVTNIADVFTLDFSEFQHTDATAANYDLWSISYDGNGLITLTAVPEPSTYGFGLGALALAAAAVRRRRKKA